MDQIWELWSPRCYVVTLSEERAEYRPKSRSCRRKTRTRVKILRRWDFREQFSMTQCAFVERRRSWILEQENPKTESQKATVKPPELKISLLDYGSHYPNPWWILSNLHRHPLLIILFCRILCGSTNRCRPRALCCQGSSTKKRQPWDDK